MRFRSINSTTVSSEFVLGDGHGIAGHDVFDFPAGGVDVFAGQPSGPEQEFEPFRPPPLRANLAAPGKISLCYHADEIASRIDHRQAANPVLQHRARH